jgi:hypothetical protein
MNFVTSVSERDQGVKVIDFRINVEPTQGDEVGTLIAKVEQRVADLKRLGHSSDSAEST